MRNLLIAMLFIATPAIAQPYLFAGIGTESSVHLGIGYGLSRVFAIEASHLSSDEAAFRNVDADGKTIGLGLSAVGRFNVSDRLRLLAKLGVHRVETETGDASAVSRLVAFAPTVVLPGATRAEVQETVLGVGAGAEFQFAGGWSARALFEQMSRKGELDRIRTFSVQAVYSF